MRIRLDSGMWLSLRFAGLAEWPAPRPCRIRWFARNSPAIRHPSSLVPPATKCFALGVRDLRSVGATAQGEQLGAVAPYQRFPDARQRTQGLRARGTRFGDGHQRPVGEHAKCWNTLVLCLFQAPGAKGSDDGRVRAGSGKLDRWAARRSAAPPLGGPLAGFFS